MKVTLKRTICGMSGRHYWYNGHLVCKTCLIEKLLEDKVIYNNDDDL